VIELQGVSKYYGTAQALHPTDITFAPGKVTVLIGPSGCGKSTLLRLINGLILPSSGTIHLAGALLEPRSLLQLRRNMGYVIQDGGLFPHLSARENILLMPKYLKHTSGQMTERVYELCAVAHFETSLLDRFPSELSGGQRQRVSLMRALILDPGILLLDEPLAALDPMVRASLQTELKQIFANLKKTVILVTHDLPEAAFFADTIILMNKGAIVQTGNITELQEHPKSEFVRSFIAAQRRLSAV
jgi:osmoprotectant transport system ATP-binding protein